VHNQADRGPSGHRRRLRRKPRLETVAQVFTGRLVVVDSDRERIQIEDSRTKRRVWLDASKLRVRNALARDDQRDGESRNEEILPGDLIQVRSDRLRSGAQRARALKLISSACA
jgi:hypothetical protein